MIIRSGPLSGCVWAVLVAFMLSAISPFPTMSQEIVCDSIASPPSIEKAREWLTALNYPCAEKELIQFLSQDSVTLEQKVDANLLLGTVYYLMLIDDAQQRRQRAKQQFIDACRAYCALRGGYQELTRHLEYDLPELRELLQEAQGNVACLPPVVDTLPIAKKGKSKMKWIIAAASALAVGTVVALVSGGGDKSSGQPPSTTPEFPDPPQ